MGFSVPVARWLPASSWRRSTGTFRRLAGPWRQLRGAPWRVIVVVRAPGPGATARRTTWTSSPTDPVCCSPGDFDVRSTFQVRTAVYDDALATHDDVVVDLTDVTSVDVVALRVLAAASRQASRDGHRLTLRGCNGAVRRLLHLTHLIRLVEVERHAASA